MKLYNRIICIVMLSISFLFIVGCSGSSTNDNLYSVKRTSVDILASVKAQIKASPLAIKWHYQIPDVVISKLHKVADILVAETSDNTLYAFDANSGVPQWMYTLGDTVDFSIEECNGKIYILAMSKLHVLDKKSGKLLFTRPLDLTPCSPMYINPHFIFVGSWDHFLYALHTADGRMAWRFRIDGYVQGKPTVFDNVLFFNGTDNRVYAINATTGYSQESWGKAGRYTTRGQNVSNVIVQNAPARIFFGSSDYNFYSLNRINGDLAWKMESGGDIATQSVLANNTLYFASQPIEQNVQFFAISEADGSTKWTVENANNLFFMGKKYTWLSGEDHNIFAVDENSKEVIQYLIGFADFFTSSTGKIGFLAHENGYIIALQEK